MRAKDAFTFLKNTPSQFPNFELIMHKKEIGSGATTSTVVSEVSKKKKVHNTLDDDGFMVINKK